MMLPFAHPGHWIETALYAGPVIVVLIAIVHSALSQRSNR
jgi:hypothetical protein